MPGGVKPLSFIGKTAVFLIAASGMWYFIAPLYNAMLAAVSERLIYPAVKLAVERGTIYIYPAQATQAVGGIYASALHYGLIVVVVLIAATPGLTLPRRLRFMGFAIVGIFAIHLASINIFVRAAIKNGTSLQENPWVTLVLIVGSDLFPVLLWGIIFLQHGLNGSRRPPQIRPAAGRKLKRGRKHAL